MAYILINRKLFNHFLWTENRTYSKFEAWLDLIQLVSYTNNNDTMINGVVVKWNRGQFPVSYTFLSKRWNWSIQKVRGYIKVLKNNNQIITSTYRADSELNQKSNKPTTSITTGGTTILTLCNYEQYNSEQQADNKGELSKVTSAQHTDNTLMASIKISKEDKEGKIIKKKPSKKSGDFIDQIVDCFVEEHGDYKIIAPGKEKAMASKILTFYKKQYPKDNSEETLNGLRIFFRQCLDIEDPWLYNNMSLPIIVNQFNKIIKILKNETKSKSKGATPNEIKGTIEKHFAIDYELHS